MELSLANIIGPRLSLAGAALVGGRQTLGRWADGAYFAYDATRDLGFVNYSRRLVPLSAISGYSFARATAAYYTDAQGNLTQFGSGVPRIGNRGLLIEGAATNLALQSQTFDNASWGKNQTSVSGSQGAPDGTATAFTLTEDTSTNVHSMQQSFSSTSGTSYTLSLYAKNGDRRYLQLFFGSAGHGSNAYANFDLQAGSVGTVGSSASATIAALANGWFRLTMTAAATATSGSASAQIALITASNSARAENFLGSSRYVTIWGAQLEATAYATSYIPTTTASATRNADVLNIGSVTGLALPYTAYAKYRRAYDSGAEQIIVQLDDGTANERCRLAVGSTDVFRAIMTDGGVDTADESVAGALAIGTTYNGAARFQVDNVIACRAGTLSSGDVSASVPASPSAIRLGGGISGANAFGGYLEQIGVYPSAYSNAALQALAA